MMPKVKAFDEIKLKKYVEEFPCLETDGDILLCTVCSTKLSFAKRSHVTQHMKSSKHVRNAMSSRGQAPAAKQLLLTTSVDRKR